MTRSVLRFYGIGAETDTELGKRSSVVIVGHGPSLIGAKKGPLIDSKDNVVRLKKGEHLLDRPEILVGLS